MFQLRQNDGRKYNPTRDIVQLFPYAISQTAALRLSKVVWHPAIRAYAAQCNLTEAELTKATVALAKFINITNRLGQVTWNDTWTAAGFDAVHPAAVLCLFFQVGLTTTGLFHIYTREAIAAGAQAAGTPQASMLLEQAAHAQAAGSARTKTRRAAGVRKAAERLVDPTPPRS